ncbi:lipase family protein [Allokutzneria sp. NRRL B-24872]|uniref:lipase family protein n=1 Tax=Allokutzneria sp. NRRL B-24872 TaxID=1137961 RepID=UPI000A381DC5|nr:lipase family protein [Allokutzneria sp. NRRL B-24872]
MSPRSGFLAALVLLIGVMSAPSAAAMGIPVPAADAFYKPPTPLPDVAPGTVLRSRQVTVKALVVPVPTKAWQVLYRSTGTHARANAVVATVLVPITPWLGGGPRPVVAYNVGSHGLSANCAPSYWLRQGIEYEFALQSLALAKGWAVVVTDYEGSATPNPHTYTAGPATGHAVLDGVRAAQRLLNANGPVGIWGYSEGGLASAWAAELQPTYAPELNLKGVAAGGVPPNIGNVGYKIDGGPFFGFFLAAATGLSQAHPEMGLQGFLNDKGRKAFEQVKDMCQVQWTPAYAFHRISEYTTVRDPIQLPQFQKVLAANELGKRRPSGPMFVYQSLNDEIIPAADARALAGKYCAAGTTVKYTESFVSEHISLAVTGAPGAVSWLADRFAGKPAPSTC